MKYVEHLLKGQLAANQTLLVTYKHLGQHENVASCLAVISELEYVLGLLKTDETYQNY